MSPRRTALMSLAALALAVAGIAACSRAHDEAVPANPLRPVRVAPVTPAALADSVHAVGLLTPKDEARLSFKVGGVIESVRVEEGAPVKAGQLLAVLKQAEIEAALEQSRQSAQKAERDLARGQALYADGVATLEQVQDLATAARVAAAARRGAEFNAAYARIVAPAAGVVLRKLAEANELVQAGQPVLVLGGAGRGWVVRLGLADRDVVRVRPGDAARVTFDAWPERAFAGRISNIASSADAATGTFAVEVQVAPADAHFVQGLVAKVTLSPANSRVVNIVPLQALVEANGNEASVFVLDATRRVVTRTTIRIGRMSGGEVEVLEGLAPGAEVVVDGAAFLENGESVRIAADDGRAPARAG
ncbi:MAG TPA: efflux RND transporter periplasmic adaptor subunit [Steroidobacteraceae bacterium]|nr:efflux RND transporter periplasmic adaptor subunit [Steroidobacteraceae bacterium]